MLVMFILDLNTISQTLDQVQGDAGNGYICLKTKLVQLKILSNLLDFEAT